MSPIGEKIRCYYTRVGEELFFSICEDEERESTPIALEAVEVFPDTNECFRHVSSRDYTSAFGLWSTTRKSFVFKSIEQGIIPDPQKDVLYVKFKITQIAS